MKRFLLCGFILFYLAGFKGNAASSAEPAPDFGRIPLYFEPNRGQTDPKIQYLAKGDGYTLFLGPSEATLSLCADSGRAASVTMSLAGSAAAAQPEALEPQTGRVNYFIGNDPARWRLNLPTFGRVKYRSVFPGIDVVYYGQGRQLEYDFMVAPGADAGLIGLKFTGTSGVRLLDDGRLAVDLGNGAVEWHRPVAYQTVDGVRQFVECDYELNAGVVRFHLGRYDRTRPLVIDPVLLYSTYLGGASSNGDSARGVAVDAAGNAYFTGYASSFNFPITTGPSLSGTSDAFVTKLDHTGTNVVFSTFVGGSSTDSGMSIALDGNGNIFIAGNTSSTNFPSVNGLQTVYGSGQDAFLTELAPSGSNILYSTYLGGSLSDSAYSVAVDANGNAYVAGITGSSNFRVTPGALRTTPPVDANHRCGFVTKINPTLSGTNSLVYSTFFGGSSLDDLYAMTVSPGGNAYVTGYASSTNFPTTAGAFQTNLMGASDAYVAELNTAGTGLVFSTLLGGTGNENQFTFAAGIAVDPDGNVYVTGTTGSRDFPTTTGAAQRVFGGGEIQFSGSGDAFITKFNPTGTALIYSTFYGGSINEVPYGLALDANRNAYIAGQTTSLNLPVRQPLYAAKRFDAFKTVNGAANWTGLNIGSILINTIAVDPVNTSNLYAGTIRSGTDPVLYKSTDAGMTWAEADTGLPTNSSINVKALAIDRTQPGVIYAGFDNSLGVYKSTNGAASWVPATNGLSCTSINSLLVSPGGSSDVLAITAGCGLFRSTNGGGNWSLASLGTSVEAAAFDPTTLSNVYVWSCSGFFKSIDGGITWTTNFTGFLPGGCQVDALAINPVNPQIIYSGLGGGSSGLYKSTNGGTSWSVLEGFQCPSVVLDPSSPETVYATEIASGFNYGVIKSTNGGATFVSMNTGMAPLTGRDVVNALAVDPLHPGELYAASTLSDEDGFVAKLDPTGSFFVYSSYLGGVLGTANNSSANDTAQGIAVDSAGNVVVVGQTLASDFPTTNALDSSYAGNQSAFVSRIGSTNTADLAVTLTANTNQISVNSNLAYTLSVTNLGPNSASAVTLVDFLPATVAFQSATPSQGTFQLNGQSLVFNLGGIPNGGSASVTLVVTPTRTGSIQNILTASANENDPALANNLASVTTTILVNNALHADLVLSVSASPNPVLVGYAAAFTFSVTNNGPDPATGVTLTNLFPANLIFSSVTSSQGSVSQLGQTFNANLGNLAVGAGATVTMVVTPTARGTVTNIAGASGNESDPNPANNTVANQTQAAMASVQVIQNGPVTMQTNLSFTLTVTNTGLDPVANLNLLDYLPPIALFLSANASQGTAVLSNGIVVGSLGTIGIGGSATLTIHASGPATIAVFTNIYQAYSGQVLLLNQTNTTTASLFVTTRDLSNSIVAGQIETSITTVSNAGPDTAVNVTVNRIFGGPVGGEPYLSSAMVSVGTTTNFTGSGYRWVQWTIPVLAPGAVATLTAAVIPYSTLYPAYYNNYTATLESMINKGNDVGYALEDSFFVYAGPGLFSFSQPAYASAAGASTALITVLRQGGAVGTASVFYSTSDGTAIGGIDYTPVSGFLTFQAGQAVANIIIPLATNIPYSGNKILNFSLTNPQNGATLGIPTTATLTISHSHVPSLSPLMLLSKAWTNVPGIPGNNSATGDVPAMTPDGRWIAFSTAANNLAEQVTNNSTFTNVFVRDMSNNTVTLASVDLLTGGCGNSNSFGAQITPDGRYVGFLSTSSDLVSNDLNNALDIFVRDLLLGQTKLVTVRADGLSSSFASYAVAFDSISSNGQFVLFESPATDLVAQAVSGEGDIYLRDMVNNTTTLISTGASGPSTGFSEGASMTPDGRYVVFACDASNLVAGVAATNGSENIYLRDTVAQTTRLLTQAAGQGGSGDSFYASITPNGRYVIYESYATNLTPGLTNNFANIFVSDLVAGTITLASVSTAGVQANGYSSLPLISTNGQFALFFSIATNLAPGTYFSGQQNIFLRDVVSNKTYLVSINAAGTGPASGAVSAAAMTPDGRYITFTSAATLVTNSLSFTPDVYLRDMVSNVTTLVNVSTNSNALGGNGTASASSITPDGRFVSFGTAANNLVAGPYTPYRNIYRRDMTVPATAIVSAAFSQTGNGGSSSTSGDKPALSANGQWAAFDSTASNLIPGDSNSVEDVFLVNLANGVPRLISASTNGVLGNNSSSAPLFSADGSVLIFSSYASDLVPNDSNGQQDVFAYYLANSNLVLVSVNTNGVGGNSTSGFASTVGDFYTVSSNGRYVAFVSEASDLVTNTVSNTFTYHAYLRDLVAGTTKLIDYNTNKAAGDSSAGYPTLSADGSTVTFASASDFLVPGVTNITGSFQCYQLYQYNVASGALSLISAKPSGGETTNLGAFGLGLYYATPSVSMNGQYVAWAGTCPDLAANNSSTNPQVFIRNTVSGVTTCASVDTNGVRADNTPNGYADSTAPVSLTPDGRYVAFGSYASDLAPNTSNGVENIYVRDLTAQKTTLVSVNAAGTGSANAASQLPQLSADGRYVTFQSEATDLVPGYVTPGVYNLYRRDLVRGATILLSPGLGNLTAGDNNSTPFSVSSDASVTVFASTADNLTPGDLNQNTDVFAMQIGSESATADLALALAAPASISTGGNITNSITITNLGPASAGSVVMTFALPAGAQYVTANSSQGSVGLNSGSVVANLGTLALNAKATVSVVISSASAGQIYAVASVNAAPIDLNPYNNSAAALIQVGSSSAQPRMTATLSGGASGKFVVAWPDSAPGFTLQTTTNLALPSSWSNITAGIIDDGANFSLTLTNLPHTNQFFRLKQ